MTIDCAFRICQNTDERTKYACIIHQAQVTPFDDLARVYAIEHLTEELPEKKIVQAALRRAKIVAFGLPIL